MGGDERVAELMAYAVELALPHLQDGDDPSPFLVTETADGKRLVSKFVMFEGEEAVRAAYRKGAQASPDVAYAAVLYCGTIDLEDGKGSKPTIVIATHQRVQPRAVLIAQRYQRKGWLRAFKMIGDAVPISEDGDPILTPAVG